MPRCGALATALLALASTTAIPVAALAAPLVANYADGDVISGPLLIPGDGAILNVDQGQATQNGFTAPEGSVAPIEKTGAGSLLITGESLISNPFTVSAGALLVQGRLTSPLLVTGGSLTTLAGVDPSAWVGVGEVTVGANGTFTNNSQASIVTSAGQLINNRQLGGLTVTGGQSTNNAGGYVMGGVTVQAGDFTNNGSAGSIEIAAGATAVNNAGSVSRYVENNGTFTNNGSIRNGVQEAGTFINGAEGDVAYMNVSGGTATNDGGMSFASVDGGTLTNNEMGQIGQASVGSGTLANGGRIRNLTVGENGTFTNNAGALVSGRFSTAGTSSNAGVILEAEQTGGQFTNGDLVAGTFVQSGGTATNNGRMNIVTNGADATLVNNATGIIATVEIAGTATNGGAMENVTVLDTGTLAINAGGTVTGTLTNAGTLTNGGTVAALTQSAGTTNNTGEITGDAAVAGGVFSSSGSVLGRVINRAEANLSGVANAVTNFAAATLNLTGTLSGTGDIINDGTINVQDGRALTGYDAVHNRGTLNIADELAITATEVVSSGVIRMNTNNAGGDVLSVDGALAFTNTAATTIDVMADGTHDTISATGNITLGGTLAVDARGEGYGLRSTFAAITSTAGEIAGAFTRVIVSQGNLFGTVETGETGTVLALRNRDALMESLEDANLGGARNVLANFDYSGTDGAQVFDAVAGMDDVAAPGLLAQLTGSASAAVTGAGRSAARGFSSLMQTVASAAGLGDTKPAGVLAYERAMANARQNAFDPVFASRPSRNAWVRGFGEMASGSGTRGDSAVGGVAGGMDVALSDKLIVGVSAGYSMAKTDASASGGEGDTRTMHGGVYAAYGATAPEAAGFGLTASAAYAHHDNSLERTITIGGLTRTASASYGGNTVSADLMLRRGVSLGSAERQVTIAPVAGVKFSHTSQDGYTETGAGSLNQTVSGSSSTSLVGVVGAQIAGRFETERMVIIPHLTALYQHEFMDTAATTTRRLAGSPTGFSVTEGGGGRSSIALEGGIGMAFDNGLRADVTGYGVWSSDGDRYGATATLKASF